MKISIIAILLFISTVPCEAQPGDSETTKSLVELKTRSEEWLDKKYTGERGEIIEREAKKLAALGKKAVPAILAEILEFDKRDDTLSEPQFLWFYHPILTDALYRLGNDAVPHLLEALNRGKESITVAVLLGRLGEKTQLRKIYRKATGKTKFYAAVGLAQAGEPDVASYLLKIIALDKEAHLDPAAFLKNREMRDAFGTLCILAGMGEKIYDVLYKELTGAEGRRRENAWTILDLIEPVKRNKLIARLLAHPSAKTRAAAVLQIYPGTTEGAKLLMKMLQEEKSDSVFKKITRASCNSWVIWDLDDIRIYIAALEVKDIKRRKKIYEALKFMDELGRREVPGRLKASRANPRLAALIKSLDISRGNTLLDEIKKDPDMFQDWLIPVEGHLAEIYAEALAAGGEKIFDNLVELVLNPARGKAGWRTDWVIVPMAAEGLKRIDADKAVAQLVKGLSSEDIKKCERILNAIVQIGTKKAHEVLLRELEKHTKAEVRAHIAFILPHILLPRAMDICENEKDNFVRFQIIRNVPLSGKSSSAPFLRKIVESLAEAKSKYEKNAKIYALRGLAAFGLKEDNELFQSILKEGKTAEIRAIAAHGLGVIGNKKTAAVLKKALDEESELGAKKEITEAIGRFKDKDSLSILKNLLKDKDLRVDAAMALARHNREEAIPVLLDNLFHKSDESDNNGKYEIERKQLQSAFTLSNLPEGKVRKKLDERLSKAEGEIPFAQKWLHTWLGGKDYVQDMYKKLAWSVKESSYAAAALARNPESALSNGNILAIEAAINSPFHEERWATCGWGLEIVVGLFPDAPQIDYERYHGFARSPQVDEFLEWYENNRFNLQFDDKTKVYRLRHDN